MNIFHLFAENAISLSAVASGTQDKTCHSGEVIPRLTSSMHIHQHRDDATVDSEEHKQLKLSSKTEIQAKSYKSCTDYTTNNSTSEEQIPRKCTPVQSVIEAQSKEDLERIFMTKANSSEYNTAEEVKSEVNKIRIDSDFKSVGHLQVVIPKVNASFLESLAEDFKLDDKVWKI